MEIKIVCRTWMKESDYQVLKVLQKSDRWLTAEELAEITGLPVRKVQHTLSMLRQQRGFAKERERFLKDSEN